MTESERERLLKILFKALHSKTRFEGRGGSAVTESERKRIPDLCSREAEGTTKYNNVYFIYRATEAWKLQARVRFLLCVKCVYAESQTTWK